MTTVQNFPRLSAYSAVEGTVALCEIDSAKIALANVLVGLSHCQPQEAFNVIIENVPQPVIALPIVDLDVEDEAGRQFILIENLLNKMTQWLPLQGQFGLAITGDVSTQIIDIVRQFTATEFVTVITQPTTEATLIAIEQKDAEVSPDSWLWLSIHAGCAKKRMQALGVSVATNVTSECPMPADAATAVLLSKPDHNKQNSFLRLIVEPNTEDPLLQPTQALKALFENQPGAEKHILIHSIPNTAQGNIELYRLEQHFNEQRPDDETGLPWSNLVPKRFNLNSTFGDIGVCQLPLLMLLQREWQHEEPVITIAAEANIRIVWPL